MYSSAPQTAVTTSLSSKIELFISCRKLKDLDVFSKSDPICIVEIQDGQSWIKVGETECQQNNLNPDFSKTFVIDYRFEKVQNIRFLIFDKDGKNLEFIGEAVATVGKIMGAQKQTYMAELIDRKKLSVGRIIVRADSVDSSRNHIHMQLRANKLTNVDGWFDKSDPFLVFYRIRSGDSSTKEWLRVHESEVVMNNLNPAWKPIDIKEQTLCNGDLLAPIKIEVWDWEKSGEHQYIGEIETSVAAVFESFKNKIPLDIINPAKREKKKKYKNSGTLTVDHASLIENPSFVDYLRSGWEINMMVAIDFTASNGEPTDVNSLHYTPPPGVNPNYLNQYERAIVPVGQILECYDTDKKFPVFGFGGIPRYMGASAVQHCFHLNGQPNPEVFGMAGILETYRYAIHNSGLYGPTYFSHILSAAVASVKARAPQPVYSVLLILTDGEIHDKGQTKDILVEQAADLPLSVIIVGVGNENFKDMEELDGDREPLKSTKGYTIKRDLVQFVKFKEYMNSNLEAFSEAVLKELPEQVVSFMKMKGIKPAFISNKTIAF